MTDPATQPGKGADPAPPAGEDIHLPGPSYLPVIVAAGIAIAIVGVVVNFVAFVFGMIVWIVAALIWARKARAEVAELPLEPRLRPGRGRSAAAPPRRAG